MGPGTERWCVCSFTMLLTREVAQLKLRACHGGGTTLQSLRGGLCQTVDPHGIEPHVVSRSHRSARDLCDRLGQQENTASVVHERRCSESVSAELRDAACWRTYQVERPGVHLRSACLSGSHCIVIRMPHVGATIFKDLCIRVAIALLHM